METCLLTLIAAPSLEDALVDWLLLQPAISGFSSSIIQGHGARESGMSIMEQVTGRQNRVQFAIHTETTIAETLISTLNTDFSGAKLHYYVSPLLMHGVID